jgi:hypothetical protein
LCEAKNWPDLGKNPRPHLIWLMPVSENDHLPLWEDGKGWLRVKAKPKEEEEKKKKKLVESTTQPAATKANDKDQALQLPGETLCEFKKWS